MNKFVATSQCETLAEWADHWERTAGSVEGANFVAFYLRRAAQQIMSVTGCTGPQIRIPREELLFANQEADFRGEETVAS